MEIKRYEIWKNNDGYAKHRIPGLLVTSRGTLLMYHEARYEAHDWAKMDILLTRSEDCGKTCSAPIVLASGSDELPTTNNPVMVQNRNGRIHFIYAQCYGVGKGRMYSRYSDDDGMTWSDPIDITPVTVPEFRNVFAFRPGHGICTSKGMLIFPVWMVPKHCEASEMAHMPSVVSTFYSLDNGETWAVGDILNGNEELQNPNETAVAELSDGRIYLNIRCMNAWRATAVSENGYSDWKDYGPDKRLTDPRCFGSLTTYLASEKKRMLLFANCECEDKRKNVTVKASLDDGKTWQYRRVIDAERGGYVEINADPNNGNIYVLYEELFGETVHLAVFDTDWLMENSL